MTQYGLNELKELANEVAELREQADRELARLRDLFHYEEDINAREAHSMIIKASESMNDAIWNLGRAKEQIQNACKAEEELNAFYEGLLRKIRQ